MGLFDNIIGTANDGEAATDMDTIIENMAKPIPQEEDIERTSTGSVGSHTGGDSTSGANDGKSSTGDDGKGTSGDDTKDNKKKKGKKGDDTEEKGEIDDKKDEEKKEEESIDITGIDIGGDMSVIDITSIEDITEITPPGDTTPELATVKPIVDTAQSPETTVALIGTPVDPTLPDIHPDTMPTEPVTSLLDITGPAPTISILDMGGTTDTAIVPESIVPVAIAPTATISERSTMSGSLGDKIGGFADELRGLKAADEILLQEKQDAKKRLEDAKKAIEDAEIAIDTEIQRIRADEVAIDDTLASLKRR